MNKTEFAALPEALQRDVRCAVACGWPIENVSYDYAGFPEDGRRLFVRQDSQRGARLWKPTTDRTIWAGLLELLMYRRYSLDITVYLGEATLGELVVWAFIRRDPLGHLKRSGL